MALKDITLGQYFPGNSLLHRLDPRTKILAVVLYIVALFLAKHFFTYAIMFCVLALCLSMLPVSALAAEDAPSNQSTTLLSDDNVAKIEETASPALVIGKLANGIADDMLTTTVMACTCKKIIAPAMNTNMYHNPIVQDNLKKLQAYDYEVIQPDSGMLACRDVGDGKMPKEEVLVGYILREIAYEKDLKGMKVIVTAGPTQESIDPVRYITNHSTGKMGYEIAKAAMLRGAEVTLVSGVTALERPMFVDYVQVVSAEDMFQAMKARFLDNDIIIKSAAVADYKPKTVADDKMKKKDGEMSIELDRTHDILKYMGEHRREGQFYCGFSMETQNMLENSRVKLDKKNIDLVIANNLKVAGSGFGTDTNVVTMISKQEEIQLELLTKEEVAHKILDEILKLKG